jgi:integrase
VLYGKGKTQSCGTIPARIWKDMKNRTLSRLWSENGLKIRRLGRKRVTPPAYWGALKKDLLPFLAERPVPEITAPELLEVLRKMEARGAVETAHRCLQYCGQVFRYAIATGRIKHDITADLKGALKPATHFHFSSITDPKKLSGLLRIIDSYTGNPFVTLALKIAPYVFVRSGELRNAEWAEIDFETATWKIPAEKIKMNQTHIVPLAKQVMAILGELKHYTGAGRYLFPSMRTSSKPISDVTLLAGLRRLDFSKEEMTVHGFRFIASTLLNEQGYNRDWIERQLAHSEHSVRAAYNYADYLPDRRRMIQEWADYLDKLR